MSGAYFGGGGPRRLEVRYRHRGNPVVSVTQVIDLCGYGADYSKVPAAVLANKAAVGSSLHRVAAGTASIIDHVALAPELVEGYHRVIKDTRAEVESSETAISSPTYGGTRDQVWRVAGRRILVDLKSRPLNQCADPVQLAGYDGLDDGAFDEHWLVELNTTRRGYRVHIFNPQDTAAAWEHALGHVLHLYVHRKWAFAEGGHRGDQ